MYYIIKLYNQFNRNILPTYILSCRSELIHRVKYNNTLPDIPFDPKFIAYPFDANRLVYIIS